MEKVWRQGNKPCPVLRATAMSKSRSKPKVSCSPSGNNYQQEMSVQINQEKMFSSQRTALFTQDMVQALLKRGIVTGLWFCRQQKSTWTWGCDSAHARKSPESCHSHPHLTFPGSQQFQSQLWHHRLTLLPVSSSKRTVSIKSNKPAPETSFFHHSFQTMFSSKQFHLYLLHKAIYFTYMSLCYDADIVAPKAHQGISVSVQCTDAGD